MIAKTISDKFRRMFRRDNRAKAAADSIHVSAAVASGPDQVTHPRDRRFLVESGQLRIRGPRFVWTRMGRRIRGTK